MWPATPCSNSLLTLFSVAVRGTFMKTFFKGAAAAALICLGTAASASTVTLTQTGPGAYGSAGLFQNVKIEFPNSSGTGTQTYSGTAGAFDMTGPAGQFFAFCVDLHDSLKASASYTINNSLFLTDIKDNMQKLFDTAYKDVDTSVEAAAFQIALWEILKDTNTSGGASVFDIGAGDFKVIGTRTPDQVKTQATAYLSGLNGTPTSKFNMTFYESGNSQDLVTVSAVPLPAAGLMLLAGLAGFAGFRRRNS